MNGQAAVTNAVNTNRIQRPDLQYAGQDGVPVPIQPKRFEIPEITESLEKDVMELCEALGALRARLVPVMRQDPPTPTNPPRNNPAQTQTGARIQDQANRLKDLAVSVREIIDALEV